MTVALVHGNPETAAIWGPLCDALGRTDVVTLSPPGFGAPVPTGFAATSDAYLQWLVEEVARLPGPIDLIGHDWGGGHVVRLAVERPDLIRSWCTDIAGVFNHDYVWHDAAQGWQSPEGEDHVQALVDAPRETLADRFAELGMGPDVAAAVVPHIDQDMARCILALYRSAAQPVVGQIGDRLADAGANPGLVVIATEGPGYEKVISNLEEVRSRGGKIIAIATMGDTQIKGLAEEVIFVPPIHPLLQPITASVPLQLLAYYIADQRGTDVDQPRNLAKSVTVE